MRELLQSGSAEGCRKREKAAFDKEEVDSLKIRVGILETQGEAL